MGYRYFDTFNRPVAYPFGYGQSYTQFAYSDATCEPQADGSYTLRVRITNSGRYAGKEVVQAYAPVRSLRHQLVAFVKTRLLQPGESEVIEMTITPRDLAYFDEGQNAWVLAKGEYAIEIAASSRDVRQTTHITIGADRVLARVKGRL